jgi:hypothetical protein
MCTNYPQFFQILRKRSELIQVFECLEQNKQRFFHNLTKEMSNKLKPVCTAVVAYS